TGSTAWYWILTSTVCSVGAPGSCARESSPSSSTRGRVWSLMLSQCTCLLMTRRCFCRPMRVSLTNLR
ncbi:unnamed protein product, partial [Heterosigma akashiwo]